MKTLISTYSLFAAALSLLIIVIFGNYEYFFNMPNWFVDPPASFEVIRQQAEAAQRFWIPLQLLFFISFITALITNWRVATVKTYLVYAGMAYLLVVISTGVYFAREVLSFMDIPVDAPKTDALLTRVNLWYQASVIRNVLQFIALCATTIAVYKKIKS